MCSDEVREVNERVCNVVETEECKDVEETECEPTFKEECFTAPSTRCNEVTRRLCETEERYCISITEFCLTGKVCSFTFISISTSFSKARVRNGSTASMRDEARGGLHHDGAGRVQGDQRQEVLNRLRGYLRDHLPRGVL